MGARTHQEPVLVTPAERSDDWYEKAAVRRRRLAVARLEKAMPLFAPLAEAAVPVRTGAEVRAAEEASWDRCRALEEANASRQRAAAAEYRAAVAARVSPEVMADLDAWVATHSTGLRAAYLAQPAYLADHWHQVLRRLDAGEAPVEPPVAPKPRRPVDPEAAYAVIAASPDPLRHADVASRLGCANVLDVIAAVLALRDAGRVVNVERTHRHRGFLATERAA